MRGPAERIDMSRTAGIFIYLTTMPKPLCSKRSPARFEGGHTPIQQGIQYYISRKNSGRPQLRWQRWGKASTKVKCCRINQLRRENCHGGYLKALGVCGLTRSGSSRCCDTDTGTRRCVTGTARCTGTARGSRAGWASHLGDARSMFARSAMSFAPSAKEEHAKSTVLQAELECSVAFYWCKYWCKVAVLRCATVTGRVPGRRWTGDSAPFFWYRHWAGRYCPLPMTASDPNWNWLLWQAQHGRAVDFSLVADPLRAAYLQRTA